MALHNADNIKYCLWAPSNFISRCEFSSLLIFVTPVLHRLNIYTAAIFQDIQPGTIHYWILLLSAKLTAPHSPKLELYWITYEFFKRHGESVAAAGVDTISQSELVLWTETPLCCYSRPVVSDSGIGFSNKYVRSITGLAHCKISAINYSQNRKVCVLLERDGFD